MTAASDLALAGSGCVSMNRRVGPGGHRGGRPAAGRTGAARRRRCPARRAPAPSAWRRTPPARTACICGMAAEVGHQAVVAEERCRARSAAPASLPVGVTFSTAPLHVPGGHELALLDVDGLAGLRRPRPAGRSGGRGRRGSGGSRAPPRPGATWAASWTSRQHRHADSARTCGQPVQALVQPRPAVAGGAGAVGLVVAGLEDVADAQVAADVGHRASATSRHSSRLSATHGPAIRASLPSPKLTGPMRQVVFGSSCQVASSPGPDAPSAPAGTGTSSLIHAGLTTEISSGVEGPTSPSTWLGTGSDRSRSARAWRWR